VIVGHLVRYTSAAPNATNCVNDAGDELPIQLFMIVWGWNEVYYYARKINKIFVVRPKWMAERDFLFILSFPLFR